MARATAKLRTATSPEVVFTLALISGLSLLGAWRKKTGIANCDIVLNKLSFLHLFNQKRKASKV